MRGRAPWALALLAFGACGGVPLEEYRKKDDEARAYRRAYEEGFDARALVQAQADALSELAGRVQALEAELARLRRGADAASEPEAARPGAVGSSP